MWFLKSRTFWGAVFAAVAMLVRADTITIDLLLQAFGLILAAVGLRAGIAGRGSIPFVRTIALMLVSAALMLPSTGLANGDDDLTRAGKGTGYELLGIQTHPYTAFGVDRLSTIEDWATAMEFGIEVDAGHGSFVDAKLTLHDILTDLDKEVYGYDQTFSLRIGWYW